ncbi:LOW QUALITY PROTEIN: UV radiation resistance-associated protein [Tribolium madens]|uniref:LOW QUALITY PROTEIN: UV radiation resistance-associated protein n=1 Tax=Tribolium madens TaxID=41895 RepID=UPI001CF73EA1|nr:LOW QUALITY PROTEIN: UV radiation resistance-associated protein [Tribolium madens]
MNLTLSDSLVGRQRSRQWTPLVTQQCRLRHVHQIIGLNFPPLPKKGSYYFTLHLTTMSSPFYTSDKIGNTNPKWPELDQRNLTNLATTALVLRVWRHIGDPPDTIVTTWGVNLSGLIYLGSKLAEIQPAFFHPKTVIFYIRGGFFTSRHAVNDEDHKKPPFLNNINIIDVGGNKQIFKKTAVQTAKSEVRSSYNINKLRKLHSLQVTIKNKGLDVQVVREKIEVKCGTNSTETNFPESTQISSPNNIRYAPQLLTMKSVNKMLEQKPTKMQRKEMEKMRNEIEIEKFRSKLLSQERDKKSVLIRRFKNKLKELVDLNEKTNIELMDNYYQLSRESEHLKKMKKDMACNQELLMTLYSQLNQRRRQLLQQLLFIYPIQQISEKKYTIHGIYLPNSDILSDCSDMGISVALGYITHVLLMTSTFLQVPLRYPMTHYGSRSYITDHVSPILPDREREYKRQVGNPDLIYLYIFSFPLFTKGKEKIQFTYAVYLLNKNIAQLRWLYFMHTPELKATLPNLLTFLEGRDCKETLPLVTISLGLNPEADHRVPEMKISEFPKKCSNVVRSSECGPGLSEILAIPEAFMNKLITSDSFKNYIALKKTADETSASIVIKEGIVDENNKNCDNSEEAIEQGTDTLDPSADLEGKSIDLNEDKQGDRKMDDSQTELLEKWMKNGTSSECCSNVGSLVQTCENFSEIAVQSVDSPLMARTDALRTTKSFNLVKPKPNL